MIDRPQLDRLLELPVMHALPCFSLVEKKWRTDGGNRNRRDIVRLFVEQAEKIFQPKSVQCEVTEFIFKIKSCANVSLTRLCAGVNIYRTGDRGWGQHFLDFDREEKEAFFEIFQSKYPPEGRSLNVLINEVEISASLARRFAATDLAEKAEVRNISGIQEDGSFVRANVIPKTGIVSVVVAGDYAYLRAQKKCRGKPCKWLGYNYYEVDRATLGVFFEPVAGQTQKHDADIPYTISVSPVRGDKDAGSPGVV